MWQQQRYYGQYIEAQQSCKKAKQNEAAFPFTSLSLSFLLHYLSHFLFSLFICTQTYPEFKLNIELRRKIARKASFARIKEDWRSAHALSLTTASAAAAIPIFLSCVATTATTTPMDCQRGRGETPCSALVDFQA